MQGKAQTERLTGLKIPIIFKTNQFFKAVGTRSRLPMRESNWETDPMGLMPTARVLSLVFLIPAAIASLSLRAFLTPFDFLDKKLTSAILLMLDSK